MNVFTILLLYIYIYKHTHTHTLDNMVLTCCHKSHVNQGARDTWMNTIIEIYDWYLGAEWFEESVMEGCMTADRYYSSTVFLPVAKKGLACNESSGGCNCLPISNKAFSRTYIFVLQKELRVNPDINDEDYATCFIRFTHVVMMFDLTVAICIQRQVFNSISVGTSLQILSKIIYIFLPC